MEEFDCVVVGSGLYGLGAAKQFRCLNPQSSLLILEREATVGGTWAEHRIYPGLKSNNLFGTYQYPDFPMDSKKFGVKENEHVPGGVIGAYLKDYAANFGILDLIQFNTDVTVAEHMQTAEGGWALTTVNSVTNAESKVFARRLILGTGLTSQAFFPHFKGQEAFGGKVFHGKDFLQNADTIGKGKTITIFGGSKSAWDAVYTYGKAGVKINWVIRSSGHGPIWISSPWVTPLKRWIEELANTRFLTWFSPCIWGYADGYTRVRNFLHGTTLGRAIVNGYWKVLGGDVITDNNYDAHPNTAKLKPWTEAMFTGPSFSLFNYDTSIWDIIKSDLVQVYIGEIDHLSPGTVHLTDGTELESDALLAHTGWKHIPTIKFLPEGIEGQLGLPHTPPLKEVEEDLASQPALLEKADAEILYRFPRLKDQPTWNKSYVPMTDLKGIDTDDEVTPYKPLTPWILYRFMVPASEHLLKTRDVAFVGVLNNFSNPIMAHVCGLWVSAYFNGQLTIDPGAAVGDDEAMTKLQYETVLYNRWGKWRYPTDWGTNKNPAFIFDAVPYIDWILRDLGLNVHRKGGFLREMWSPYKPGDYQTVNEEWKQKGGTGMH